MAGAATGPRALSPDALHWRAQAEEAIKEREAIKQSMAAEDGPAAFWRRQAKDATAMLGHALRRHEDASRVVTNLRNSEQQQREAVIKFSEELDALKRRVGGLKQQLWDVWSRLDDADPTKRALWDIWGPL